MEIVEQLLKFVVFRSSKETKGLGTLTDPIDLDSDYENTSKRQKLGPKQILSPQITEEGLPQQGTKEYFELRELFINASDFAKFMGVGYYENLPPSERNYNLKLNKIIEEEIEKIGDKSASSSDVDNEHTERGKRLEPIARDVYAKVIEVSRIEIVTTRYCDGLEFLAASPDGKVIFKNEEYLLEIKCPKDLAIDPEDKTKLRPSYFIQIMIQMMCFKIDKCHLVLFTEIPKDTYKIYIYEVTKNDDLIELIEKRAKQIFRQKRDSDPYTQITAQNLRKLKEKIQAVRDKTKLIFSDTVHKTYDASP